MAEPVTTTPDVSMEYCQRVAIAVKDLSYWPSKSARVLTELGFIIKPGELTGILGASGSGKTTLLNAIMGRIRKGKLQGTIKFITVDSTGAVVPHKTKNPKVAYIMTKDQFLPRLTVKELITSAADLKMSHLSTNERKKIVEKVIEEADLEDVKDIQVHNRSPYIGLAEMKRVSLAIELLDEPSVILLDEPTSGVDSSIAFKMIQQLKRLAVDGNRTIVCTVHQPRSSVFNLFSRVLLLGRGQLIYAGPPASLASYFEKELGLTCPPLWSAADFALEVAGGTHQEIQSATTTTEGKLMEVKATEENSKYVVATTTTDTLIDAYEQSQMGKQQAKELDSLLFESDNHEIASTFPPIEKIKLDVKQWCHQTNVLIKRQFKSQLRNPLASWLLLLANIMQGIVIGSLFWQLPSYANHYKPIQLFDITQRLIPYNNSIYQSIINEFQDDRHHPILDLIDFGPDGRHSDIFTSLLTNKTVIKWVLDGGMHMFDALKVSNKGYPSLDWIQDFIDQHNNSDIISRKDGLIMESKSSDDVIFGDSIVDIAKGVQNGSKILQLLDHLVTNYDWSSLDKCAIKHDPITSSCYFYMCVLEGMEDIVGPTLAYLQWPELKSLMGFSVCLFASRRLEATEAAAMSPPAPPLSYNLSEVFSENFVRLNSDILGITPYMEKIIGEAPLKFIKPLAEAAHYIWECQHAMCLKIKSFVISLKYELDIVTQFALDSFTTLTTMFNISGVFFFLVLLLGFSAYDALLTFPQHRALFNKETISGLYIPSTYYVAIIIADIPFQCVASAALSIIIFFMVGLHTVGTTPIEIFVVYCCICILVTLAAYGFGYMISAASPSMEVAMLIAPIFLIVWLCIAGFFLRTGDLPRWILWFKFLSFYRWGFFAHVTNLYRPGNYYGTMPNELNLLFSGIHEARLWFCCLGLALVGIFYRCVGFFALKYLHRNIGIEE